MTKEKTSKYFTTYLPAATTGMQALLALALGAVLLLHQNAFVVLSSTVFVLILVGGVVLDFCALLPALRRGWRGWMGQVISLVANFVVTSILITHLELVWQLLPLLIAVQTLAVACGRAVTFWQYRHEPGTSGLRTLIQAATGFAFSVFFWRDFFQRLPLSLTMAGFYFIAMGLTLIVDFLDDIVPRRRKNQLKKRVRIALPVLLAAFIPSQVLRAVNRYFETQPDPTPLAAEKKQHPPPNVEIFVHVSPDVFGSIGHVDMAIEGVQVSYGCYDDASTHLNGAIGPGVLFQTANQEAYLSFCRAHSKKTLIGFGLYLQPESLARLKVKLSEIMENAYPWAPPAASAPAAPFLPTQETANDQPSTANCPPPSPSQPDNRGPLAAPKALSSQNQPEIAPAGDYASLLYQATGASFYKFAHGSFQWYFVLGTNCVKLVDTLLVASGAGTVVSGIISPGTYYDFLDREFQRPGGAVLTRTVYHDPTGQEKNKTTPAADETKGPSA